MPLVNAIEFLVEDDDPRWVQVLDSILKTLIKGRPLSAALRLHPQVFPSYYVGSIASAEMSGQLVKTLGFLEEWLEREASLQARLKKALTYPTLVLTMSLVMVLLLFNTVIPRLMESFQDGTMSRSWPTEILILMTKVLSGPIFYLGATLLILGALAAWRHEDTRSRLVRATYMAPVVGPMLCQAAAMRYVATFVLLMESGGQLLPTLRAAAGSSGSPLLGDDAARIVRDVSAGDVLSQLWAQRPFLYPAIMVQMGQLGESTSSLADAMQTSIPYLEMETYSRLDNFLEMVEPILISGVALFIGFVAIAVILPISQMTAQL